MSSLLEEGVNTVEPLYVESSKENGRIISPYYRFESINTNYSDVPEPERRKVLETAADYMAWLKSKGIFVTDLHLGNIAWDAGDWFEEKDPVPILPEVNLAGSSLTAMEGTHHNFITLGMLWSPRVGFLHLARRDKHQLVQNISDIRYFNQVYRERLEQYTSKSTNNV